MMASPFQGNLILAWLWITLGFLSGAMLGFNFKFFREEWLGGYSGRKRRLYRLGHISLFGLGVINLMFWLTAGALNAPSSFLNLASWSLLVGAVTMPICCFTMAHRPGLRGLFYIPVASLIIGGVLTLVEVIRN